ncbi:MAG TPA: hypothetical protein VFD66_08755 [Verrucomicrobiae bacterium]|nr:hypothetical protein [Verrucomicrobiae bacterium]
MRLNFRGWCGFVAAFCLLIPFTLLAGAPKESRFEAFLVWATNGDDAARKPVTPEIRKKLKDLPLKWKNYFEINRTGLSLPPGGTQRAALSKKCSLELTDVDGKHLEIALIGKGEPVLKRTQSLSRGELLVLGGNAPDETGWLVVLKRIE